MLSNVSSAIKDVQGITKKQEEIRNTFTSNCQPTTAHFNIVQRVTAGLSILHKELIKQKLAMELKKETETSSVYKRKTKTTHTVWLQETKTLPTAWKQETKAKPAVWQQDCNLFISEYQNTEDNGHAGTSRYHPEAID